jgi:hypothetical protein
MTWHFSPLNLAFQYGYLGYHVQALLDEYLQLLVSHSGISFAANDINPLFGVDRSTTRFHEV